MLILADANGFGINFDQFGQGIHQPAPNAYRPAHSQVQVWKFPPSGLRCGIDRGPSLIHQYHWQPKAEFAYKCFGFPAGGAIANGDSFDLEPGAQFLEQGCRGFPLRGRGGGVDCRMVQQTALGIQHGEFGPGAKARVQGQHQLLPKGGR
ncbi:hypothetical protein DSECCO2_612840 [anaerobic digester metagenome]